MELGVGFGVGCRVRVLGLSGFYVVGFGLIGLRKTFFGFCPCLPIQSQEHKIGSRTESDV